MKIGIIGTYPPRKCGIATFTQDFFKSIRPLCGVQPRIIAVSDGTEEDFPEEVCFVIDRDDPESYMRAMRYINIRFDVIVIQHEYGIFGGEAGRYIVDLARELTVPLVTNFHTVLKNPRPEERTILQLLAGLSRKVTVMTRSGINLLSEEYRIIRENVVMIPHGVPQFPHDQEAAKRSLDLEKYKVMLSFGFLGPGKGIETALKALPAVRNRDFRYIVLGATHPNVLQHQGETYRESLIRMTERLGVSDRVQFVDQFVDEDLLVRYLCACDIYVTPYPNAHQISSGTLSFAIGAGAAVLSTPYWYAQDLLSHHRGQLFDFGDYVGLSELINQLLEQPRLLARYRRNAANYGKRMSWNQIGKLHYSLLEAICAPRKRPQVREYPTSDLQPGLSSMLRSTEQNFSF